MSLESERGPALDIQDIPCSLSDLPAVNGRDHGLAWRISFRVALVTFIAFAGILDNGFVAWDDTDNFLGNLAYQGLGSKQICWAWTTFWMGVYQPLGWILAEVEYVTSGLNPRGYHLASLFLHMACAVVLYVLTFSLLGYCQPANGPRELRGRDRFVLSGLVTVLFTVHPLRVEPVAWASGQAYLPCALFAMLSVLCYLWAHGASESPTSRSRGRWLAISVALFTISLLSKAASLGLPGVLLVLDVYPLCRLSSGKWSGPAGFQCCVWLEKLPYVALSLIFGVLAVAAKQADRTLVNVEESGIMGRLALACYSVWFYLIKTLWPINLHAFPMRPEPLDWTQAPYVVSMLGTIVVSVGLYRHRRHYPGWLAAWLAYLLLLAPTSGLVTYGRQAIGDRYSYLAITPWVALIAGGLCQWWARADLTMGWRLPRQTACLAIGLAWMACLMVLTWRQCQTWENSGTLWTHAIQHGGAEIADLHNNLGVWRARDRDFDAAVAELKRAVWLRPDCGESHVNLANALSQKGELDKAIATLRIASWRWPDHIYIRGLLGKALFEAGRYTEAADQYATIARLHPGESSTHLFLGHVLARGGKYAEAASQYAEALRLAPKDQEAQRGRNNVRRLMEHSRLPDPPGSPSRG